MIGFLRYLLDQMLIPKSKQRLIVGLVGVFLSTLAIYVVASRLIPQDAIGICLAWAVCINIYLMYRWRSEPPVYDYEFQELRALVMTIPLLENTFLPFSSWAMEPEALVEILSYIQTNSCETIVECGAGISTVYIGSLLKQSGRGRLYSLENDERWYGLIAELLARKGLDDFVTLIYAPLQPYPRLNNDLKWYDVQKANLILDQVSHIDLLLVDGPPSTTHQARLPALYFFDHYLDHRSLIVLDDARRPQEQFVLSQWQKDYRVSCDLRFHTRRGQAYIRKDAPR